MKNALTIAALILLSFTSFGQDTIRTTKGTDVVANIMEINESVIIYIRFDQPDGPLNKILKKYVSEIIYANGNRETIVHPPEDLSPKFGDPGTINTSNEVVVVKHKGRDRHIYPGDPFPDEREKHNKQGKQKDKTFYLEGVIAFGTSVQKSYNLSVSPSPFYNPFPTVSPQFRIGTKYYVKKTEKQKIGINMTWVKMAPLVFNGEFGQLAAMPLNVGIAYLRNTKKGNAFEINSTTGLAISNMFWERLNISYGLDAKYRIKKMIIGIDVSGMGLIQERSEYGAYAGISFGRIW